MLQVKNCTAVRYENREIKGKMVPVATDACAATDKHALNEWLKKFPDDEIVTV